MTPRPFLTPRRTPRDTPHPASRGFGARPGLMAATWADSFPDT
jgi:hypothetical protein